MDIEYMLKVVLQITGERKMDFLLSCVRKTGLLFAM